MGPGLVRDRYSGVSCSRAKVMIMKMEDRPLGSGRAAIGNGDGSRWGYGRAAEERDEPIPPAARGQPRGLVAVVTGGLRGRPGTGRAGDAVGGLLGLPLVPRDGARVVRGRADRGATERQPGV